MEESEKTRKPLGFSTKLQDIGFYTLSDARAESASEHSRLMRCELVLTGRCNFNCPYCRNVGGPDDSLQRVKDTIRLWASDDLYAIRFSGGEPTIYPGILDLVELAKSLNIEHIAISTNGAASELLYQKLVDAGVNDFSISLDACCAEDGDNMAGGIKGAWERVVGNIRFCASKVYTTVGVVLTESNVAQVNETIKFAHSLGISDIRIIPAAQNSNLLKQMKVDADLLDAHPILSYRFKCFTEGIPVRGLRVCDNNHCPLVLDDMVINQGQHWPCIIYMREGGAAIGKVGINMRAARAKWNCEHDVSLDALCNHNCLDVCREYNNRWREYHAKETPKV
jgi:MoaA/NifB/PqqE/SkfB family radical SAM enzyme